METADVLIWSIAGSLVGCMLSCVPGLHVASVLSVLLVLFAGSNVEWLAPFVVSLAGTYCVIGFIPLVFLSVPDEGLFAAVSPSMAMLKDGFGLRAVILGGAGALMGVCITVCVLLLVGNRVVPALVHGLSGHWYWIVWAVILFMLLSEWPRRVGPGVTRSVRLAAAWRRPMIGLMIFLCSGILGLIVFYRAHLTAESAYASVMPMVTGMFSVPWLCYGLIRGGSSPEQEMSMAQGVKRSDLCSGFLSGWLAGAFSALVPGVTSGVGGLLAGHACSLSRRDAFVVAQGSARATYIIGGLMLLFVPGVQVTRGACSIMLASLHSPVPYSERYDMAAVALISTAAALFVSRHVVFCFLAVLKRTGARFMQMAALLAIITINIAITGPWGLAVLSAASMIGGACILYGARRLNCLGCILVPVAVGLSGWGGVFQ